MRRHTHWLVDQIFSCISRHFSRLDLLTLDMLKAELLKAYTMRNGTPPEVFDLTETADVKGWLEAHAEHVSQFKDLHYFEFDLKVVDGERLCILSAKPYCASSDDNRHVVGRVLKQLPLAPPLSAACRPLFFSPLALTGERSATRSTNAVLRLLATPPWPKQTRGGAGERLGFVLFPSLQGG